MPPLPSLGMVNISASTVTEGVKATVAAPVRVNRSVRLAQSRSSSRVVDIVWQNTAPVSIFRS
jgi:hypothetical protein